MSITNATLKESATSLTVVAGDDLVFTSDGEEVKSGVHTSAAAVTDFRIRPSITLQNRNPKLIAGVFTKAKRTVKIVLPKILADGSTVYNVRRVEAEDHPECTVAEVDNLNFLTAQVLSQVAYQSFLRTGNLE